MHKKNDNFLNEFELNLNNLVALEAFPISIFQHESDFFQIVVAKDKIQQIYKELIKKSHLINNTYERLKQNDYIRLNSPIISKQYILAGMAATAIEFTKWITQFLNAICKSFNFNSNDLSVMISIDHLLFCMIHTSHFVRNNQSYFVLGNNIICSNNVLEQIYGNCLADFMIELNTKFNELCLTKNEVALLYPFILTSCSGIQFQISDQEACIAARNLGN